MASVVNLGDLFDRTRDQNRVAIVDLYDAGAPRQYSYRDIDLMAGGVATLLRRRGLPAGARVAILSLNRVEYIAAYFGIMRAGYVAVPVNIKLPAQTIAHILNDAGVACVFVDAAQRGVVPGGLLRIDFDDPGPDGFTAQAAPSSFQAVVPAPDTLAQILYTSGSSGVPKGVPLTHSGQLWSMTFKPLPPDAHEQRQIVAQPLFHMNGLIVTKLTLMSGGSVVLMPKFDAAAYFNALLRYHVTAIVAIPTMVVRLLKEMESRPETARPNIRHITLGSAPVTVGVLARIQKAFPAARLQVVYGTTESGASPFGPHPDGRPTPLSALGVEIDGSEVRLEGGADENEGELMLRNPAVMGGYLNLPAQTERVLSDGWYRSGDIMRRDADGFFYFVGRADDMFVCAGENIYPSEIEILLERHPAIQQAVVVPLPDEERGQVPVAFIVLQTGKKASADEVKQFALEHAPAYQHPRRVAFMADVPWIGTNKIDRKSLESRARELEAANGWSH